MRQRAFTLLEVLLVIAILGLIAAFIYPDLQGEQKRRSLVDSADALRNLVVMTQAQAMQEGVRYRIEFPGTPDPLDQHARKETDVPQATEQPIIKKQADAVGSPDIFDGGHTEQTLRDGTRCIAVVPWSLEMFCSSNNDGEIAGPGLSQDGQTSFVPLTLNPDGTCDKIAFVLTDLPPNGEMIEANAGHILYVIIDSRTGQGWVQRAWRVRECELFEEEKVVSPVLRIDFTKPDLITRDNATFLHGPSFHGSGSK